MTPLWRQAGDKRRGGAPVAVRHRCDQALAARRPGHKGGSFGVDARSIAGVLVDCVIRSPGAVLLLAAPRRGDDRARLTMGYDFSSGSAFAGAAPSINLSRGGEPLSIGPRWPTFHCATGGTRQTEGCLEPS